MLFGLLLNTAHLLDVAGSVVPVPRSLSPHFVRLTATVASAEMGIKRIELMQALDGIEPGAALVEADTVR